MRKWSAVAGLACALVLGGAGTASAAPGDITTIAGGGSGGDGGPAVDAALASPFDCDAGPGGTVYMADNNRIRRVGADGVITTFAGGGPLGVSGEGGPATEADIRPAAVAVDAAGTVFVGDGIGAPPRILAISPDGTVRRLAGSGAGIGFSGDGGPAIDAEIGQPLSLALTRDALYFHDFQSGNVRRIDLATLVITSIDALASTPGAPGERVGLAAGPDGSVYVSREGMHDVRVLGTDGQVRPFAGTEGAPGFAGDGGPATAAQFLRPVAMAVDAAGNVFVADRGNNRIRRIDAAGVITTIAGTGVEDTTGDGGPATQAAVGSVDGLGVLETGALCLAGRGVVRQIEAAAAPTPLVQTVQLPPPTTTTTTTTTTLVVPVDELPETGANMHGLPIGITFIAAGIIVVWIARSGAPRGHVRR